MADTDFDAVAGSLNNNIIRLEGTLSLVSGQNNRTTTVDVGVPVDDYVWAVSIISAYSGVSAAVQNNGTTTLDVYIEAVARRQLYNISTAFDAKYSLIGVKKSSS